MTKDIQSRMSNKPINKDMSFQIHHQGDTYQCWAYSTTTMIRHSWKFTLDQMEEAVNNGTWTDDDADKFDYNEEMEVRESSEFYLEIRNLMMMIIIPKRIHKKDPEQGAYLRASIVRVSLFYTLNDFYFDDQANHHYQQATERRHASERVRSPAIAQGCGGEKQQAQDGKHRVRNTGATEGLQHKAVVDQPHQHQNKAWGQQANRSQKTHRRQGC